VVHKQLLGHIGVAVQRRAHESRAPLFAVAHGRLLVVDQRWPRREPELSCDRSLCIGQPRRRVVSHPSQCAG
jgi:hypothetical protein